MSRTVLGCVVLLAAAGCGDSVPPPDYMGNLVEVTGTVKIDGQPTAGVQVGFVPRQGIGAKNDSGVRIASGTTDAEGKFSLITPPGGGLNNADDATFKGALPGQYAATFALYTTPDGKPIILDADSGKSPVDLGGIERMPPKFGNPMTTPHQVEVKSGTPQSFDFDLKTK